MQKLNFQRYNFDCFVYFRKVNNSDLILYVNDILLACRDMKQIVLLKQQGKHKFKIKDLGYAMKILGMKLIRNMKDSFFFFISREFYQ